MLLLIVDYHYRTLLTVGTRVRLDPENSLLLAGTRPVMNSPTIAPLAR